MHTDPDRLEDYQWEVVPPFHGVLLLNTLQHSHSILLRQNYDQPHREDVSTLLHVSSIADTGVREHFRNVKLD